MYPVVGVCVVALFLFIVFLVLWFKSKEKDLTVHRLVLTRAFPTEARVTEMSSVYHPHIRDHMFNYNPSLFMHQGKRYTTHRLSTYNMCKTILEHISQFKATLERDGVLNSIVIQTPLDNIIFVDYPSHSRFPCPEAYEDSRSIILNENLVLIVNNPQHDRCDRTMVALFIPLPSAEELECQSILRPSHIVTLSYEKARRTEKNWMPFVRENKLYFVYSVNPHVVLHCDTETGQCTEAAVTHYDPKTVPTYFRGGSPCLLLKKDNHYLAVAHARHSIAGVKFIYTSVFYLFESEPPFSISAISPEFFLDDDFQVYRFQQIIQFVAGLVKNDDDGRLYISYGVQDCKSKVLSLPLDSALALLSIPVSPLPLFLPPPGEQPSRN